MSRSAKVYIKGIYAGLLTEIDREHYSFCYDTDYYNNPQLPAVSLTMPKTQQESQPAVHRIRISASP